MSGEEDYVLIACAGLLFLTMVSDRRGTIMEDGGRTVYLRTIQSIV
jgi:hypothetical protein